MNGLTVTTQQFRLPHPPYCFLFRSNKKALGNYARELYQRQHHNRMTLIDILSLLD